MRARASGIGSYGTSAAAARSCWSWTCSRPHPAADLGIVREELRAYDPSLATRPSLVVGTKLDLAPDVDAQATLGSGTIAISAVTGERLDALRERIASLAHEAANVAEERSAYVVLRPGSPSVRREEGG